MKFALALVASMAYATKEGLGDYLEDAVSVTLFDDFTWDVDFGDWEDDWSDDWDWEVSCYDDWHWEDCSWSSWRYPCQEEVDSGYWGSDCGWVYWDEYTFYEYWVSCDDWAGWEQCNGSWDDETEDDWEVSCYDDWIWEDCSWSWWRNACDEEVDSGYWGSDCGWVYWDDWTWTEYWVTCDDWNSW